MLVVVTNLYVTVVLTNRMTNWYAIYIMINVSENFASNMSSSLWFGCVLYSNDICCVMISIPLCSIARTKIHYFVQHISKQN